MYVIKGTKIGLSKPIFRIIGIVSKIDFHLENSKQLLLLTFSDTLFSKDGLDEKILKLKFVISSYPIA